MADLPNDILWKLSDDFTDDQLTKALDDLYKNPDLRNQLGTRARHYIRTHHEPKVCANNYADAIEHCYKNSNKQERLLINKIASLNYAPSKKELIDVAWAIDQSMKRPGFQKQLLVDVSKWVSSPNVWTGIQRVVRSVLKQWLLNPPQGYRVEPVYSTINGLGYKYARKFTMNFMDCHASELNDETISYNAGDLFIGLDFNPHIQAANHKFYQMMRNAGVCVQFVVYDLLPITFPEYFFEWADKTHHQWLDVISECDGAICISRSVAKDLDEWCQEKKADLNLKWFHLGADLKDSVRSTGILNTEKQIFKQLKKRYTFLWAGTVEPRKGHEQVLDAFELLWRNNIDINLVIVGKHGWMVDALVERLQTHIEKNKRLFWLQNASDESLEQLYTISSALIAASYGEGFGLSLIEASWHKLPIIARDIPVFREIAGEHAYYFDTLTAEGLAQAIEDWLILYNDEQHPSSTEMPWLTWSQSANDLLECIIKMGE